MPLTIPAWVLLAAASMTGALAALSVSAFFGAARYHETVRRRLLRENQRKVKGGAEEFPRRRNGCGNSEERPELGNNYSPAQLRALRAADKQLRREG